MVKNLFFILFLVSISLFSQDEKRLALVIGNSNYDKGELKNPVNDARLIASTLDSLDFDVILKENLATKRDMTAAIREFGSQRSEYDVAIVYYAGHGIQVDDENFLLPTKEVFEEEFDVLDYGVSVQNIMRYLRAQTNEVNILILDACRDNPYESKWNITRSLKGGGLAKIPPPTGSLIAFSTDSGQTAPDGDGDNSIYTVSLANNMLLEDTSIDQVFRNVRAEVLAKTDGIQRPVEATQLTGQTFYLLPNVFEDEFEEIDKLITENKNIIKALELSNIILSKDPENYKALKKKADILSLKGDSSNSDELYEKLIELNPSDLSNYFSYVIHENYSRSAIGLLRERTPENMVKLNTIAESVELNKNPWLLFTLTRFQQMQLRLWRESGDESHYKKVAKYFEIAEYETVNDLALSTFRDFLLVPSEFVVHEDIYNDLISLYKFFYYDGYINDNEVIEMYYEFISNRNQKNGNELIVDFAYILVDNFYRVNRFEEGLKLCESLLETKNISGTINLHRELYNAFNYELYDFDNARDQLRKAYTLFIENRESFADFTKLYVGDALHNELTNFTYYFDLDYVETLKITDKYIESFNEKISEEYYSTQIDWGNIVLIFQKNYLSNIMLGRYEQALEVYKKIENLFDSRDFEIKSEKYIILSGNYKYDDEKIIRKIDEEVEGRPAVYQNDLDELVFSLFEVKTKDELFDNYIPILNEYIVSTNNSQFELSLFSKLYDTKKSHLRILAWSNYFEPRIKRSNIISEGDFKEKF